MVESGSGVEEVIETESPESSTNEFIIGSEDTHADMDVTSEIKAEY